MNIIQTGLFSILAMIVAIIISPLAAEERVTVFELAESGVTISFPMSADEILKEDITEINSTDKQPNKTIQNSERMAIFEMGESGQTVSFPMTSEEKAVAISEEKRLNAYRDAVQPEEGLNAIVFELAESGEIIVFPLH